jgi:hypothetical protein
MGLEAQTDACCMENTCTCRVDRKKLSDIYKHLLVGVLQAD